jgi:antitoxin MazE
MSQTILYKSRLRPKGQITVPGEIRSLLGVNEGDELVFFSDEKGRIIIDRVRAIDPDQAWFWTESWQKTERKAQEEIDQGSTYQFDNIEEALKFLHQAASEDDAKD